MMKKLFFILCLGISVNAFSQSIDVNPPGDTDSTKNLEELIKDVFIGPTCATVSNFTSNVYEDVNYLDADVNDVTGAKSYAYFTNSGAFPMDRGIIMSSGAATASQGPNDFLLQGSQPFPDSWAGDADIKAILDNRFGDDRETHNATVVEFDFVPIENTFSFQYLFASDEYEEADYECSSFQDGFAFIVSGPGITNDTGITGKNIALLADGVTPVSVGTIHNNTMSCSPAQNPTLYVSNTGANAANAATNYNGRTIVFTASQAVTPGETYHMKMVIADREDNILDSAVFLLAGSFNAGGSINLGDNVAICSGDSTTLTATSTFTSATYEWQHNGNVITGETGLSITATQTGTYTITATEGNCTVTDTIEVLDLPFTVNNPADIILADTVAPLVDGVTTFDLTQNGVAELMGSEVSNVTITYHLTQADADSGANPIANPGVFTNTENPQRIYIRVQQNGVLVCYDTASFLLIVNSVNNCFDVINDQNINCLGECVDLTASYAASNTTGYNTESITYSPQDPFTGLGNTPTFPSGMGGEYNDTPIDIPFTFSYFGNCFTQLRISNNGAITFKLDNNFAPYVRPLPETFDTDFNNTIFGLISDNMDLFNNPVDVSYGVFGTAPNRRMVFGYNQIPDNDCPAATYTFQIVLFETTNVIEVYIQDKPDCPTAFFPEATVGIQNGDGSAAYTPPGRNGVAWTATNEAWRFNPSGDVSAYNYEVNWYDLNNNLLETGSIFNVCPTTLGATTYIVKTEDQDNVGPTFSDTVVVTVANTSPVISAIAGNTEICPGEFTNLSVTSGDTGLTYQWQLDESDITGETNNTLNTNQAGNYTVTATNESGCTATQAIVVSEKQGCIIPNGISPNNDTINDTLDLSFLSNYVIETFKVYNRYGSLVYEFNNYTNEFGGVANAGIMNGGDLPTGTYYFVADLGTTHPNYGDQIIQWVYINREQ